MRIKEKIANFEDLYVWQKAHKMALLIYKITKDFPVEEKYGLTSQMRRAAVSIAANIAEGFKKRSRRDKMNFYNISQGSLSELEYYLILTEDLGYYKNLTELENLAKELGRMLNGLIASAETLNT